MKVLFLYLKAFSFTGGIEKFNRSLLKALHELSVDGRIDADAISAYDTFTDEKYFPRKRFVGYGGARPVFAVEGFVRSFAYQQVIIGHINLAVVGYAIKLAHPSVRIILIAHGIEVWETLTGAKRKLLECADTILAVSFFTKSKILEMNPGIDPDKIKIFPNTIDPYIHFPDNFSKPEYLLKRYGISNTAPVLVTVTRLSSSEKYKGYDGIIESMPELLKINQELQYLICGKADKEERLRIEILIDRLGVKNSVKLLGFIADEELSDHYLLADVFIMQSTKEGFGIVFIEALACGRRVIAGNRDGSVDALVNGALGTLIDPDSKDELMDSINKALHSPDVDPARLQHLVKKFFGFPLYKERLKNFLIS